MLIQLETLEEEFDKNLNCQKQDEYNLIKSELEFIYNKKALGSIIRSRCQYFEENEKNTKYFLNLEKRNYNTKHIKTLKVFFIGIYIRTIVKLKIKICIII